MKNPGLYLDEIKLKKIKDATRASVSGSTICRVLQRNGYTRKKIVQVARQRCTEFRGLFMAEVFLVNFLSGSMKRVLTIYHHCITASLSKVRLLLPWDVKVCWLSTWLLAQLMVKRFLTLFVVVSYPVCSPSHPLVPFWLWIIAQSTIYKKGYTRSGRDLAALLTSSLQSRPQSGWRDVQSCEICKRSRWDSTTFKWFKGYNQISIWNCYNWTVQ